MPVQSLPMRTRHLALLLVGAAMLGTGCARGCTRGADLDRDTPQDLRGPAPVPGEHYHDEGTITLAGGTMTITAGGRTETASADMVIRYEEDIEVLAVTDGRVTKERVRVLRDELEMKVRVDGQTDSHTDKGPLLGETYESERLHGVWKHRLVGKEPTARQRSELERMPPPQSALDWMPEGLVKPGHQWDVDAAKMNRLFGPAVTFEQGRWQMTFEGTVKENGTPAARVAEDIDVSGRARDDAGEWQQITLKATGATTYSLAPGRGSSVRVTGTIRLAGRVTEGGQAADLVITGPVTAEGKTTRR